MLCAEMGIDWKATALDEIRVTYIRRLREQAAGRAAVGDLDLAGERAALAKAQRERIEMQNAVTRRELAPVYLIEEVLAKAGSRAARILDAIPGAVRRRAPELPAAVVEHVQREIIKARNIAAAITLEDLREDDQDEDDAPAGADSITEAEDFA